MDFYYYKKVATLRRSCIEDGKRYIYHTDIVTINPLSVPNDTAIMTTIGGCLCFSNLEDRYFSRVFVGSVPDKKQRIKLSDESEIEYPSRQYSGITEKYRKYYIIENNFNSKNACKKHFYELINDINFEYSGKLLTEEILVEIKDKLLSECRKLVNDLKGDINVYVKEQSCAIDTYDVICVSMDDDFFLSISDII